MTFETKRTGLLIALAATSLTYVSCSAGRNARELDRNTALEILNENRERIGPKIPLETKRGRLDRWKIDLVCVVFKQDSSLPLDVNTKMEMAASSRATYEFMVDLADAGILRKVSTSDVRPWSFSYLFAVASPAYAQTTDPDSVRASATFVISRPVIERITGITQDGIHADVQWEYTLEPTEVYKRIGPAVSKALQKYPSSQRELIGYFGEQPWWTWPSFDELKQTRQLASKFTRYDDGWRLEL